MVMSAPEMPGPVSECVHADEVAHACHKQNLQDKLANHCGWQE